jgi:hypothetical protein
VKEIPAMRQTLLLIAAALMLIGAVLLMAGIGAPGLWITVITLGIALVALDSYRSRHGHDHI